MKDSFLENILRLKQSVFSFKELVMLFNKDNVETLKSKINYYVKQGRIHQIRRGLYSKDINYNKLELATKIYSPSYISLETVLQKHGIIFQYYSQIFVISYQTREIKCDEQTYIIKKIQDQILTNPNGIELKEDYSIATIERAILDTLYIYKDYHFDNLEPVNWDIIYSLIDIYDSKILKERLNQKYDEFKKERL